MDNTKITQSSGGFLDNEKIRNQINDIKLSKIIINLPDDGSEFRRLTIEEDAILREILHNEDVYFTPLRIESAQSNVAFSLKNPHIIGRLNEKRCKELEEKNANSLKSENLK